MREILFRGKENPSGKWVEGFLVGHCHIGDWVSCTPIHSKTVGQFTGLTDKNGAKIFEGDICTFDDEMMVVEWHDEDAMFFLLSLDGTNWTTNFSMVSGKELEAIGNIHDNPELLEKGGT